MVKCEQIKNLLSPYVDGMVDDKDKALIDAHISVCPKCRQQVEDYRHISDMMRHLESPALPGDFAAELNRRVRDEQNTILGSYTLKTPKKSGWAAAALAVFALTGGIYASSHWSLGSMVTAWHESKENQKKPLISIDNIIERFQKWQGEDETKVENVADVTPDDNNNKMVNTPVKQAGKDKNTSPDVALPESAASSLNNHISTLKVEKIETTLPQVLKIASNYEAAYTIIPAEEKLPEDSQMISRGILLEVEPSKAEQLIKEVEALGIALVNDETADEAKTSDIASPDQAVNDEPPSQARSGQVEGENSEPELLIKHGTEQSDAENRTVDGEENKDSKITLSIYLIEEKEQILP